MRRGLVVGKFMPLHRGHQLLIETALANVDELTVVVYDIPVDDESVSLMPASKRAGWVSQLYPQIHDVVVLPDIDLPGTYVEHDNPSYSDIYAEQVKFLGPFTHVFSSEDYGKPYADALNAEHVTVDAARQLMPISGTTVRSDIYKYRAYVDPLVYRSLIQKVVFVGTESTGKSTLAKRMAEEYKTMHTLEYGRTLWADHETDKRQPTFHDLLVVGDTQYNQEQAAALHSNRYLFCDTNAWTTMHWSLLYHNVADQRLVDLAEITMGEYIWIMCDNDFDWVDDGLRELHGNKADILQKKLYTDLCLRLGDKPHTVYGSLEDRVSQVKRILES